MHGWGSRISRASGFESDVLSRNSARRCEEVIRATEATNVTRTHNFMMPFLLSRPRPLGRSPSTDASSAAETLFFDRQGDYGNRSARMLTDLCSMPKFLSETMLHNENVDEIGRASIRESV